MRIITEIVLFAMFDDQIAIRAQELFVENLRREFFMESKMKRWVGKNDIVLNVFCIFTVDDTIWFIDLHHSGNLQRLYILFEVLDTTRMAVNRQ